jgi:hypothetical protein
MQRMIDNDERRDDRRRMVQKHLHPNRKARRKFVKERGGFSKEHRGAWGAINSDVPHNRPSGNYKGSAE